MIKAILVGIAVGLVLLVTGYGQSPTPFDTSKIDYSTFTPEEIAATEAHRDQLKGVVKDKLNTIVTTSDEQGIALQNAKLAFEEYKEATESQISKGNKAIAALDHVLKKLHLAKWILCGLWIAACGLLYLKLPLPLKSYGLYGVGALAVGGITFIWSWL